MGWKEPPKYARNMPTREEYDAMVDLVRAGNYRIVAARALKIPQRTFEKWASRGRRELNKFAEDKICEEDLSVCAHLMLDLDSAEGESESAVIKRLMTTDDPKVLLTFLKQRFSSRWNGSPESNPDKHAVPGDDSEIREEIVTKLKAIKGGGGDEQKPA